MPGMTFVGGYPNEYCIFIDKLSVDQSVPSPCTSYALFKDGEFLTNEQQNDNRNGKINIKAMERI